jgi:hypothetical protein
MRTTACLNRRRERKSSFSYSAADSGFRGWFATGRAETAG